METVSSKLRDAFESNGWRWFELETSPEFDGLFSGGFATCAVVLSESASDVVRRWADFQGALAHLKAEKRLDELKDLYLVFIVERVDEASLGSVQRVLDDTRVCRKIILERGRRSLADTLDDIPFFSTPGTKLPADKGDVAQEVTPKGISAEIRQDLERRSAQHILERLLSGGYEVS